MVLGSRIAAIRTEKGWSQAELARRLHISASAVGMYEQGRREPPLDVLINLAGTLGVSIEFLLTGKNLCGAHNRVPDQAPRKSAVSNSLKTLSREDLLVLLTAELFGNCT